MDRNGRRMRGPPVENSTFGNSNLGAAIFGAGASRRSFDGGLILIGIFAGAGEFALAGGGARGEGRGVGTGDPLEAGTLSVAGTPVPFGEIFGAIGADGATGAAAAGGAGTVGAT